MASVPHGEAVKDLVAEIEVLVKEHNNKVDHLAPDVLYVCTDSIESLEDSIAETLSLSGDIRVLVLPTTSLKDCDILQVAANKGFYHGRPFTLVDNGAVIADKLDARAAVDEALLDLDGLDLSLDWMSRSPCVSQALQHIDRQELDADASCAQIGSSEWVLAVEGIKMKVQQDIYYLVDEGLPPISNRSS